MAEDSEVIDNPAMHRFELLIGDEVAAAYCTIEDGRMVFTHSEAPFAFSGRVTGPSSHGALSKRRVRAGCT
jgi:hypothetical protein